MHRPATLAPHAAGHAVIAAALGLSLLAMLVLVAGPALGGLSWLWP